MVCSVLMAGCGIKGPPVPPRRYRPAAVSDLSYELNAGRVELHWTLPPEDDQKRAPITGCTVQRSQFPLAGTDCIDCDASFKRAADVTVPKVAVDQGHQLLLRFAETLTPGFEYAYRVICSTAAGVAGDESNVVSFAYPQSTTR